MPSLLPSKAELMKTAVILEGFKEFNKAARYYAKAQEYARSAKLYEKIGDLSKAGDNYFMAKKFREALKMYTRLGRKDRKVAILYEKTGNFRKAAEIWKLLKSNRNWKRCLLQSRQLSLFDLKL